MFVGRKQELLQLNQLYEKDNFQMPVIYGRRRVGKSTLIQEFVKGKKAIFFTAIESGVDRNLKLFSQCLYQTLFSGNAGLPPFPSFEDAFDFLTGYVMKEQIILVIDEYPYLAEADSGISSILQNYIDQKWKDSKLYLILCGSSLSFMETQVLGYKSPLYGRRTAQIKVQPFDYLESAEFVPAYTAEEKALAYGVTGGIPKYLSLFDPDLDVYENIKQLFFRPTGYLYEEPSNLLKQELRNVATYNGIIEAIAGGAVKLNEIATKIHMDTAATIYCMKSLISIGIVEKEFAITDEKNKKKTGYRLTDQMFCFWYRFVPDGIPMIQMYEGETYFDEIVKPQLSDYMGKIFECMCRVHLMREMIAKNVPFMATKIGRWWGTNPKIRREEEIDIVAVHPIDKSAVLGECKYRNETMKQSVAEVLVERSDLIKNITKKYFVLYSKSGFEADLVQYAKEHGIVLYSLQDMYGE